VRAYISATASKAQVRLDPPKTHRRAPPSDASFRTSDLDPRFEYRAGGGVLNRETREVAELDRLLC
jgi:hypothetical protein